MMLGLILLPAGLLAASFATSTWHLYLSQGACVGAGVGFLYMPAMPIVSQWFDKKRSLANGICAAGSGIAGLIMCFVTQAMLDRIGLAWALRVTAIIAFTMNAVSTALMRSRNKDINPTQRMFDYRLLRRYEVILVLAWSFVMMFGYITLMFSLSDYTRAIGRSASDAATVVALLNLGAALIRPLIGVAADRYGRINIACILTVSCGILCFVLWLPTKSFAALIVFSILGGGILGVFWSVCARTALVMILEFLRVVQSETDSNSQLIGPISADIVDLNELPSMLSLVWLSIVLPSTCKNHVLVLLHVDLRMLIRIVAEVIALALRREQAKFPYLYTQIFGGFSYLISSLFLFELLRVRRMKAAI